MSWVLHSFFCLLHFLLRICGDCEFYHGNTVFRHQYQVCPGGDSQALKSGRSAYNLELLIWDKRDQAIEHRVMSRPRDRASWQPCRMCAEVGWESCREGRSCWCDISTYVSSTWLEVSRWQLSIEKTVGLLEGLWIIGSKIKRWVLRQRYRTALVAGQGLYSNS